MYLGKAIRSINPDARFMLTGDDLNNIEWIEDTTPIAVSDIETKMSELKTADETTATNEATAKATAQASGNTKLLNLGLTQAEATALTGYTPE